MNVGENSISASLTSNQLVLCLIISWTSKTKNFSQRKLNRKNVAKYMYKTNVNILFKYTSSRNVLFRYDTYQRKSTKA